LKQQSLDFSESQQMYLSGADSTGSIQQRGTQTTIFMINNLIGRQMLYM